MIINVVLCSYVDIGSTEEARLSYFKIAQDDADAFEWEKYFADHRFFKDCRFDPETGWQAPAGRNPALMIFGESA